MSADYLGRIPCSGLPAHCWCGIAVLPCFSASGKVPVTRCGLPLRGTYAACGAYAPRKPLAGENDSTFSSGTAYWSSSRLDCHTLPTTTLRKVVAPIPSGQTGLDASRQAQFSAGIVILCGVRREPPTSAGRDPATGGTDQTRTGGLLIPNQAL